MAVMERVTLTEEQTKKMFDYIKGRTKQFALNHGYKIQDDSELSIYAQQVREAIEEADLRTISSNLQEKLAIIISAIIGEDLTSGSINRDSPIMYISGACVIPITNRHSHNYPIRKPTVMTEGDPRIGYRIDGTKGNYLDANNVSCARPANDAEIMTFIEQAGSEVIKREQFKHCR